MKDKFKSFFYYYLLGDFVKDKIIIIESDDWGSIRVPSPTSLDKLNTRNIDYTTNPFNLVDTLESSLDFEILLNLLDSIERETGKKVVITANIVMCNPDFERIKEFNFEQLFIEDFRETYIKYEYYTAWELFQNSINHGYIKPQFHAREHLNGERWLSMLQKGHLDLMFAFENNMFCIDFIDERGKRTNLMPTYLYNNEKEKQYGLESIEDGLKRFEKVFKEKSLSTIAPVGIWDTDHEEVFFKNDVKLIQSFVVQKFPNNQQLNKKYRYFGGKNLLDQKYLQRNVFFEPSTNQDFDWVSSAMSQISKAFFFSKPATISMHRLNFVGGLDPFNRDESLKKFNNLLRKIILKWPDVKFISSDQMINYI